LVPPALALVAAAVVVTVAARRVDVRPVLVALAALVLAWAPFVPGEDKYVPTAPGIYDRVNIVAGFAIAALVCALAALARGRAIQVAVVVAIGIGWAVHGRAHVEQYSQAADARSAELAAIERAVPRPAPGTVMIVLQRTYWAAPGVPVFGHAWDLGGALKMRYDDASLGGYPVTPGTPVRCERDGLVAGSGRTPYTRALLVDASDGTATRISDARACRAALRSRPGSA
jgi:hypothetical protein